MSLHPPPSSSSQNPQANLPQSKTTRYLKQLIRRLPFARYAFHFVVSQYEKLSLRNRPPEDVFTEIQRQNRWGGKDSFSGTGSDLLQTQIVRIELPKLFRQFGINSMLDIPCGDFHWMKQVDLSGIKYSGADIVSDLIDRNRQYETDNVHFYQMNMMSDKLMTVDLVFCRDCLVHLSFSDAFAALKNIIDSDAKYLLTTTFTSRSENRDIITGQWRTLNLEIPPFSFSPPLKVINERCTEGNCAFTDKSLGLWKVEDIKRRLM